jgi:hypothetical protein
LLSVPFGQIHKIGRKNKAKEANVKGGDQFLGKDKIFWSKMNGKKLVDG